VTADLVTWLGSLTAGAAWLVTFALHSTALLGALWLAGKWLARLPDPVRESLVKFALVAPLLSATLQVALVAEPAAGHLATVTARTPAPPPPGPAVELSALEALLLAGMVPTENPAVVEPPGPTSLWGWLVVSAAGLAATLGLLSGLRLRFGLWRILRRRRPVISGPLASELSDVQRLAGLRRRVRLSTCDTLPTPIALGILRPEICLPTRVLSELDPEQRAGMLAHELAHIARWDPLWLCAVGFLERLFYWQPLYRMGRKRLRELAEYRSDAWAARLTGGLPLARCLVVVADWVVRPSSPVRLVPCMAQGGSNLKGRIDRLLEGGSRIGLGLHALWIPPVFAGLLLAMTSALPGATWNRGAEQRPDRAEPVAVAESGTLAELLTLLDGERQSLADEVEALRGELPAEIDEELTALMAELDRRLTSLDRHQNQLMKWLMEWTGGESPGQLENPR
jgi:Zn-dependent protease with chaperone function